MGLEASTLQKPKIEVRPGGFLGVLGRYAPLNGQQYQGPVRARIEKTGILEHASVDAITLALAHAYVRTSKNKNIIYVRKIDDVSKVVAYYKGGKVLVASVTERLGYFEAGLKKTGYVSPYDVLKDLRF